MQTKQQQPSNFHAVGVMVKQVGIMVALAAAGYAVLAKLNVTDSSAQLAHRVWSFVYFDLAKEDSYMMFVFWTNFWGFLVYWFWGLLFSLADFANPSFMLRYKIQPTKNVPVSTSKFLACVARVLFNQIVIGFLLSHFGMPLLDARGIEYHPDQLPSLGVVVRDFVCFAFVEEIGFYYSHRLVHEVKFLYKNVHKIHHEWPAPVAITARYAHPLEDIMSNLGPVIAGPIIMGSHMSLFWAWILVAISSTLVSHSGYHLPFFPSAEQHDYHHLAFNVNYGVLGILDEFHGTDIKFRNNVAYLRHQTLTTTKSARELYPDDYLKNKGKEAQKHKAQ